MPGWPASSRRHGRAARAHRIERSLQHRFAREQRLSAFEPMPPACDEALAAPGRRPARSPRRIRLCHHGPSMGMRRGARLRNNPGMTSSPTNEALAALRKSYERAGTRRDFHRRGTIRSKQIPRTLARRSHRRRRCPSPNAMTLCTVGNDLRPSSRIVLIKGYADARGLVWYTNYESREAAASSRAIRMLVAAVPLGRARARGAHRGRGRENQRRRERRLLCQPPARLHRIGAWASPQSEVITAVATCW